MRCTAHSGRELFQVPRSRRGGAKANCVSTSARPTQGGSLRQTGHRGQQAGRERVDSPARNSDSEKMPPPKSGKKITPKQLEILRRWVASGARYQQHWSLITAGAFSAAKGPECRLAGADAARCICLRPTGGRRIQAGTRSKQGDTASSVVAGPDRIAADTGRTRRVSYGRVAERL